MLGVVTSRPDGLRFTLLERTHGHLLRLGPFAEEISLADAHLLVDLTRRVVGTSLPGTVVTDVPSGSLGELGAAVMEGVEPQVRRYSQSWGLGERARVAYVCRSAQALESSIVTVWPYRPLAVIAGEGTPGNWAWLAKGEDPSPDAWADASYLMVKFPHGLWVDLFCREQSMESLRGMLIGAVGDTESVQEVDEDAW